MPDSPVILAIDQGTTSCRTMAFSAELHIVASARKPFNQFFPAPGWVEHDPEEIWRTTLATCAKVISTVRKASVAGIGIANQRETTIIWNRDTGEPVYPAIVWQDRRTANYCRKLQDQGHAPLISELTGLLVDPYFSASKIRWILDHRPDASRQARQGDLLFGTVDSFLVWKLTGGRVHATDVTNASRTMLFNIHTGKWDRRLLDLFDIPAAILPEVKDCTDDFGQTDPSVLGIEVPICGVAGDQQAALVGQACLVPGMTKCTFGTGGFIMMNTGQRPVQSENRLLTTVGYRVNGTTAYALEGSIFNTGSIIQWLRDELGIFEKMEELDQYLDIPQSPEDVGKTYLVPAFTGLGAPYWNSEARGILTGIARNTGKADLIRAALESVCYQTLDLSEAMFRDSHVPLNELRVDGGMTANAWMLQFLADVAAVRVRKSTIAETTALGVAGLTALQLGFLERLEQLDACHAGEGLYTPCMSHQSRMHAVSGWKKAVKQCLTI